MKTTEAIDGITVSGPQGIGILRQNINGWDVYLNSGEVRQSVDLSEWNIEKVDAERKKPLY